MKMSHKLLVATALLFGLILVGWWQDKKEAAKHDHEEKESKLLSLKTSDLKKINLTTPEFSLEFVKREKNDKGQYTDEFAPLSQEFSLVTEWMMTKPSRALIDYSTWTSLLSNLDEAKSLKTIADDTTKAKDYALDAPALVVDLYKNTSATQPDETLKVGDENTAKSGFYAIDSQRAKIVLTENKLQFAKSKKLLDWRDSRLIGFKDVSKVKEITFLNKGKVVYVAAKKSDTQVWKLMQPHELPASPSDIDAVINQLDSLKLKDIASEDIKQVETTYGLDHPDLEFRVVLEENGQDVTKVIKLSTKGAKKDDAAFHRSGFPLVSFVRSSVLQELDKKPEQLVSKRPFQVLADKVTHITVVKEEKQTLEFSKQANDWVLEKSQPVKTFKGFFKISSLEGSAFLGKTLPKHVAQLGSKLWRFELHEDKQIESLVVYKNTHQKDKADYYVGKSEPSGFYYELKAADVEGVANDIEDVLDKKESHPVEVTPAVKPEG